MIYYFVMKEGNLFELNFDYKNIEVREVRRLISESLDVNDDNVILIANGGFYVQNGLLESYDCGDHENNPIFVFLKQKRTETTDIRKRGCDEWREVDSKVKSVLRTESRSLVALHEIENVSAQLLHSCQIIERNIEESVRDQFLVVEGWSAAVANLSDSLNSIESRVAATRQNIDRFHREDLKDAINLSSRFEMLTATLATIPLLQCLVSNCDDCNTLLDWLMRRDSRVSFQSFIDEAHKAFVELVEPNNEDLETLNQNWGLRGMVGQALQVADRAEKLVAHTRPQEEEFEESDNRRRSYANTADFAKRLEFLGGLREEAKRLLEKVQSHREYAGNAVRKIRDVSNMAVLQDHLMAMRKQLNIVREHQEVMVQFLAKSEASKIDIVDNVEVRKNWLQNLETQVCSFDETLFLVRDRVKRVRIGLRLLEQMSTTPLIYIRGVAEVVRRQRLLDLWYSWGVRCSQLSEQLREDDRKRREHFAKELGSHFVQSLFQSLCSFSLPKIGNALLNSTKHPLPAISQNDLDRLSTALPHLRNELEIPVIDPELCVSISMYKESLPVNEEPKLVPISFPVPISANKIVKSMSFQEVSLPPVPDDTPFIQSEKMFLSQAEQLPFDDGDCRDSNSSPLIKSLDSIDYQITTETTEDLLCVPRSVMEKVFHQINEIKTDLSGVRHQIFGMIDEVSSSKTQIGNLLSDIKNESQITVETAVAQSQTDSSLLNSDTSSRISSKTISVTHKDFQEGDAVCFMQTVINNVAQWRMLTTDNRIYFLHDENFPSAVMVSRRRRDSASARMVAATVSVSDASEVSHTSATMIASQIASTTASSTNHPALLSTGLTFRIVTGSFIQKEEYICKKVTNRYGLPVNTKFFRVRAHVDWPKDSSS